MVLKIFLNSIAKPYVKKTFLKQLACTTNVAQQLHGTKFFVSNNSTVIEGFRTKMTKSQNNSFELEAFKLFK